MKLTIACAMLVLAAAAVSPAHADPKRGHGWRDDDRHNDDRRDYGRRGRQDDWQRQHWREHENYGYQGYRAPPPVYYEPRRAYSPPPGIFIPFR